GGCASGESDRDETSDGVHRVADRRCGELVAAAGAEAVAVRLQLVQDFARRLAASFEQIKVKLEADRRLPLAQQAARAGEHFVLVALDVDLQQVGRDTQR